MKYRCLVLDHDDTVVNSTSTIHYPAYVAYMEKEKPGKPLLSLEEYFRYNFDPGVIPMFRDICGLTEKEMEEEEIFWSDYVKEHVPKAYPGIREILWEHKKNGGLICVVSHSFRHYVLRDYRENGLPEPDLAFGWELDASLRKPEPWSLFEIMKTYGLAPSDMLVLDDLKPGYDMAKAAGVPFAAAGWANNVPEIMNFMRKHCERYFRSVEEFAEYLNLTL